MSFDLLISLKKYTPTAGRNPLENYITEAFAWMLRNNASLSKYILDAMLSKLDIDSVKSKDAKWKTQVNIGGFFPDMVCEMNDFSIVIENKAWASLHEGQIDSYRLNAKKIYPNHKVVLITAGKWQHEQNPDLAICWSDIYNMIISWSNLPGNESNFIAENFNALLDHEGMGPSLPMSIESMRCYFPAKPLENSIDAILQKVKHENFNALKTSRTLSPYYAGKRWGRMGIDLFGDNELDGCWRPNIFFGFILDGEDHCIVHKEDHAIGPCYSFIISFDENLHGIYRNDEDYLRLVKRLSDSIFKLGLGWEFYKHLDDIEITRHNEWHPIHFRKSMIDMFRNVQTVDDQIKVFTSETMKIFDLLNENNEFVSIEDKFRIPKPQIQLED